MLYSAQIILGLFAVEMTYQLTSTIASDALLSVFDSYAIYAYDVLPPANGVASQAPSDMISSLELSE